MAAAKWAADPANSNVQFQLNAVWPKDPQGDKFVNCAGFVERAYKRGAKANLFLWHPNLAPRSTRAKIFSRFQPVRAADDLIDTPNAGLYRLNPKSNIFYPPGGAGQTVWP